MTWGAALEHIARRLTLPLLLASLSACTPSETTSEAPEQRALEIVVPTEFSSLDPRFTTRALDIKVTRLVHAGLAGLDPDTLEPVPLVAKGWSWRDSRHLDVELRPGLKFHSGKPLEVSDVCATLKALADERLGSPHRVVAESIGACLDLGESRLELTLANPRATLLSDLEVPILRADQAASDQRTTGALDGLGPYSIAHFDWGEVDLRAVPGQAAALGLVERAPSPPEPGEGAAVTDPASHLVIRTVRDENARALRLMAGSADIAPNAISATILPALAKRPDLQVRSRSGANVTYMLFQNDRPPTNDRGFRKAIASAIDRQLLVDSLLAGKAEVASGLFPRGHWSADPEAKPIPYDLETAKPTLSAAPPITLTTSTDRARLTIARAIAQMLEDAGAKVRVVALDLGVLLKRLDSGDFELAILQMPELTEPNILNWFFNPHGIPGEGGEGKNRARYRSSEVGTWLDRASASNSRDERAGLYLEIARRMAKDLPVLPLWHEDQVAVVSTRASGFALDAIGRWGALAGRPEPASPAAN
ncbi:MAG: ABC transporter substrate-binding protein [Myxococcales bacterium]|nr:ABC transporter substrate-binding protein [Myxococcales bacterium]